jgi:hypothetical protein
MGKQNEAHAHHDLDRDTVSLTSYLLPFPSSKHQRFFFFLRQLADEGQDDRPTDRDTVHTTNAGASYLTHHQGCSFAAAAGGNLFDVIAGSSCTWLRVLRWIPAFSLFTMKNCFDMYRRRSESRKRAFVLWGGSANSMKKEYKGPSGSEITMDVLFSRHRQLYNTYFIPSFITRNC